MRPLKRPMFRTGGPIKEGVMNGLRDGGVATTMADATGYAGGGRVPFANGGAYVKNPDGTLRPSKGVFSSDFNKGVYNADGTPITIPKRNFFEDASFVLNPFTKLKVASMLTKGGIRGGKEAISGGLGSLKNFFKGPVPARKAGEVKNRLVTTEKAPFLSDKFFGQYIKGPLQSTKKAFTDAFGPAAGSIKDYKTTVGLGVPATGFGAYKMYQGFKDRQKGSDPNDPNKILTEEQKRIKALEQQIAAMNEKKTIKGKPEPTEEDKLNRIYSLLGVDRAKRNAASKALIDMSRYIDEGGKDVISKKNIGSTISKGISAFDKRLDKVDQLKEAAGLMQAKAEIEAMSDPYSKEYKKQMTEKLKRENNPTARDYARAYIGKKTLSHPDTVTIGKSVSPNAVVLADAKKAKAEGIGEDITAEAYVKDQIKTQGGDVAGVYIVDKVIIQVDAQGNTTQLLP
tara:strand:- start:778 stop:2145 length:1368 start_codon:yes stop_codon:yes gene_type:complete